jgi:hypothetical protein
MSPDNKYQYPCKENCLYINIPCEGECHETYPLKCGEKCIPNNGTCYVWDKEVNGLKRVNTPK